MSTSRDIALAGKTSDGFRVEREGIFTSELDLLSLDIIDWRRLNGYWKNTRDALHNIASWLINTSYYTVTTVPSMSKAPKRSDFPGWRHVGGHEATGCDFWNWFHTYQVGELNFSDAPDFYGMFATHDVRDSSLFYGDIGIVSPIAFIRTLKNMRAHDLWISVLNDDKHITIEPVVSIVDLWASQTTSK